MKKLNYFFVIITIVFCVVFSSCGKGYEVRVANYNTEILDTVIIGDNAIVFSQIERQTNTEYRKIKSGDQSIKMISKTKQVYNSSISISKKGGGKRTIQIDGLNHIAILED